jgi:hypothetical protein
MITETAPTASGFGRGDIIRTNPSHEYLFNMV